MKKLEKKVTVIPATVREENTIEFKKRLRVAAYCRVSTDSEEQLNSYEAQKAYYTEKIMTNPNWVMAGIFADEGISGRHTKNRTEFLKLMELCRNGKVDMILIKSVSRFARNTLDSLGAVRELKDLNIPIIFEKENINTAEVDGEFLITMFSAFAQAESESMSQNVKWGKRQAMKEGKVGNHYTKLYGYRKGEDGEPEVVPEEARVVKIIYDMYLSGSSTGKIKKILDQDPKAIPRNGKEWSTNTIRSILKNENYCGDVLMQKTYVKDCMTGKVVRNKGELDQVYISDHHEGIVTREQFQLVQSKFAERSGKKAPSIKTSPTGLAKYSSKYALTGKLVCGECGTPYKRCSWKQKNGKRVVWRCVNRLDNGKKYCKKSPTMDEASLYEGILDALNKMPYDRQEHKEDILARYASLYKIDGNSDESVKVINDKIKKLNTKTSNLLKKINNRNEDVEKYKADFNKIKEEIDALKKKRKEVEAKLKTDEKLKLELEFMSALYDEFGTGLHFWEESVMRNMLREVVVVSKTLVLVTRYDGCQAYGHCPKKSELAKFEVEVG